MEQALALPTQGKQCQHSSFSPEGASPLFLSPYFACCIHLHWDKNKGHPPFLSQGVTSPWFTHNPEVTHNTSFL